MRMIPWTLKIRGDSFSWYRDVVFGYRDFSIFFSVSTSFWPPIGLKKHARVDPRRKWSRCWTTNRCRHLDTKKRSRYRKGDSGHLDTTKRHLDTKKGRTRKQGSENVQQNKNVEDAEHTDTKTLTFRLLQTGLFFWGRFIPLQRQICGSLDRQFPSTNTDSLLNDTDLGRQTNQLCNIRPAHQKHYIFGSLHKSHAIHWAPRNYTCIAFVLMCDGGVCIYIKKVLGNAVLVSLHKFVLQDPCHYIK